jgi:hypothetical protein
MDSSHNNTTMVEASREDMDSRVAINKVVIQATAGSKTTPAVVATAGTDFRYI